MRAILFICWVAYSMIFICDFCFFCALHWLVAAGAWVISEPYQTAIWITLVWLQYHHVSDCSNVPVLDEWKINKLQYRMAHTVFVGGKSCCVWSPPNRRFVTFGILVSITTTSKSRTIRTSAEKRGVQSIVWQVIEILKLSRDSKCRQMFE